MLWIFFFLLIVNFIFKKVLGSQQNWEERREIPYLSCPDMCITTPLSMLNIIVMLLLQSMNLHWHIIIAQKSIIHLRFTLEVVHFKAVDKCIMTNINHCSIIWNSFTALKSLFSVTVPNSLIRIVINALKFGIDIILCCLLLVIFVLLVTLQFFKYCSLFQAVFESSIFIYIYVYVYTNISYIIFTLWNTDVGGFPNVHTNAKWYEKHLI